MFDLGMIFQQIAYGLVVGSSYVLMAAGFSLIWGIMGVLNLAHGEFYMLGAYTAYYASILLGLNPITSTLCASIAIFFFGIFFERVLLSPLYEKKGWEMNTVLITIGASIFLQNLALIIFGEKYKGLPMYFDGELEVWKIVISYDRIVVFLVGALLIVFLWYFMKYTRSGLAMRAISQNREGAYLAGVNVRQIFYIAFGLSAAFAAAAGALLAPIFFVYPTVGAGPLLMAFAIVIFGGLGSVKGAIYAGFLVGILESLVVLFISSAWKEVFVFILVIFILILRPRGLFGIREE
jgi:branched-chain amino acid transport system permease protein